LPLLPSLLKARGLARRDQLGLIWIAIFIGVDYAFYTASLTTTQVSRAILLFYMAPVWGTLLEVFVLRQPLTLRRGSALALGFAGLIAIFGIGLDMELSLNLGDALALLSGILWSIGLLFVLRHRAAARRCNRAPSRSAPWPAASRSSRCSKWRPRPIWRSWPRQARGSWRPASVSCCRSGWCRCGPAASCRRPA
jgi:drug/metabolite transporter (DMT)-like permease